MRASVYFLAVLLVSACDSNPKGAAGSASAGQLCGASSDCQRGLACLNQQCVGPGGVGGDASTSGSDVEATTDSGVTPPADASAPDTHVGSPFGCSSDGWCNAPECALGDDPDCNPTAPCDDLPCGNNTWDPNCACNYYGGVCEAIAKCSDAICSCDTDCTPPDGSLSPACGIDGFCDSYCPKGSDADCAGNAKDGKYCGTPSCNKKAGYCNAKPGTTSACPEDPDCDGFAAPCESDSYCDPNCSAGADPDC